MAVPRQLFNFAIEHYVPCHYENHQGVRGAEPPGFAGGLGGAAPQFAGGSGGAGPWYCRGSGGRFWTK